MTDTGFARSGHQDSFARDNLPPRESWPDLRLEEAGLAYPERLNCVAELLDRHIAEGRGGRTAVIANDLHWSYADLAERVNRIANVLTRDLGLVSGNRVLLRAGNTPMMVAAYLAVLKAGGIAVATMPMLRAGELAYPLRKAKIALALCDHRLTAELEGAKTQVPELARIVAFGIFAVAVLTDRVDGQLARRRGEVTEFGKLADPIFGVGDTVDVGGSGMDEPLQGVVAAAQCQQRLGVGVEQSRRGGSGAGRIGLGAGQHGQRLLELTEVGPGTGGHDPHLVGVISRQFGGLRAAGELDGPLVPSDAALAVGDQRQELRLAAHPAGGPELRQGLLPVAALVGGDADGLAHRGDAPGAGAGGLGVGQCGLRILLEQFAGGDQVTGHRVGGRLVQSR